METRHASEKCFIFLAEAAAKQGTTRGRQRALLGVGEANVHSTNAVRVFGWQLGHVRLSPFSWGGRPSFLFRCF